VPSPATAARDPVTVTPRPLLLKEESMPLTTDDIDYVIQKLRMAADKLEHGDALSAAILLRLAFRRFPELLSAPQRALIDEATE
jgi:hypothetical protein